MKVKTFFQFMFFIVLIIIMQGGAFYFFSTIYDAEVDSLTTSIDALTAKIDSLEAEIGSFKKKISEPAEYVKVVKNQIASPSGQNRAGAMSVDERINQNLRKYLGQ